ncbi:hypothetical protein NKH77_35400 [Streptomyces sp. M19]
MRGADDGHLREPRRGPAARVGGHRPRRPRHGGRRPPGCCPSTSTSPRTVPGSSATRSGRTSGRTPTLSRPRRTATGTGTGRQWERGGDGGGARWEWDRTFPG